MLKTFLFLFLSLPTEPLILVDKIVAVVNDQVITISDLEKAIAFYPLFRSNEGQDETLVRQVLLDLIHYKTIWLEYRNEFTLNEEDFEEVQAPILQKLGAIENLHALLRRFDMEWDDFRSFIVEKVLFDKVVREKFPVKIPIAFSEIEEFYNREYLPSQQQLELQPLSLVEMAPMIEKHLRKRKTEERLSGWLSDIAASYHVEIKLRNGA